MSYLDKYIESYFDITIGIDYPELCNETLMRIKTCN